MKLFTLYADLALDTSGFKTNVENAKKDMTDMQTEMTNTEESAKKTGKQLENAFGHALGDILSGITQAAIETAFTFAEEGIELASSMEEIANVVDATFGDESAARINAWARTTKESYGIGALSAKEYASTMGSTLKGLGVHDEELYEMSTALVGLAGDMASFKNITAGEAFSKIMSGITGTSTEPLGALGIMMDATTLKAHALAMGLEKDWDKLDRTTQTQVRFNYLMQQTADMHGDFAETSESYSNQMRVLQENIEELKLSVGESLLPVMTEMVSWFNSLFGSQENAIESADDFKASYADNVASIAATTTSALELVSALEELSASTEDAASSETWGAILNELQRTIPGIGDLINEETGKIEGGTQALKDFVEQHRKTSMELARQKAVQDMYDAYGEMQGELAMLQTTQTIADIRRTGAEEAMLSLGADLLGYMLEGMESAGASAADIAAMKEFGTAGAENLLKRISGGGSANMIMGALLEGGDIWKNKSFMQYFEAGGGTQDILSWLVAQYSAQEEIADEYDVDYRSQIAAYEEAIANKDAELDILNSYISQMDQQAAQTAAKSDDSEKYASDIAQAVSSIAMAAPVVNVAVSLDGQELAAIVTAEVERQLSRNVSTKSR